MLDSYNPYRRKSLETPSEMFHEASKLLKSDTLIARTVWSVNTSPAIKKIISKPATLYQGFPMIQLPAHNLLPSCPLDEVMRSRRSARRFSGESIPLSVLSSVLYYSGGVTRSEVDSFGITWGFRCSPSGGALYPIDLFCFSLNVEECEDGLYVYDPDTHSLRFVKPGRFIEQLSAATYLTEVVKHAAVCLLMVANFPRTKFKYGERGYRFALLEAGHIAQNMLLVAASLGTGALPLGGYVDDELNTLIGVDGCDQAIVYGIIMGMLPSK